MAINESKRQEVFTRRIKSKVGKAISEYGLVESGDSLLLGVSGGKDSMALLHMLANRAKFGKIPFNLKAMLIKVKNLPIEIDTEYMSDFCRKMDVPFLIHEIIIPKEDKRGKNICFLCSWYRRKALFEQAKNLGCNKLALGHNMDDAIETLLMNMAFQGAIASTPASLDFFNGEITVIRPLIKLTNKELEEYARLLAIPDEVKNCPHERKSGRALVAKVIQQLENENKSVRYNLFASMMNIQNEYLPEKKG